MKTHTVITLFDGAEFTDLKKALNHCDEMMGAELRTLLYDAAHNGIYKTALKIVSEKAYDVALKAYVAWRAEHDALTAYGKETEWGE